MLTVLSEKSSPIHANRKIKKKVVYRNLGREKNEKTSKKKKG